MISEPTCFPHIQAWFRDNSNENEYDGVNYVYAFVEDGKNNPLLRYFVEKAIEKISRFGFNFIYTDSLEGRNPYTERQMTFNIHNDACHASQVVEQGDIAKIECNVGPFFGLKSIIHEIFHALGESHQQQHPDARNFFTIVMKGESNYDPLSDNYFTGDFNPDGIMMYPSSILGASLRPKSEILSMLEAKGHNRTIAEAIYNSMLMSKKTMGMGHIIPRTDFQGLSAIARFINPNIQGKEIELPLLAVTDLLPGGHDIAADPLLVFNKLKAYKYPIVEAKRKILTLDYRVLETRCMPEDPPTLCWEIDLKKFLRLPNDLTNKVSCKLHNIACAEQNNYYGLNFSLDDRCTLKLHRTPIFGSFSANISVEFSQAEHPYQTLRTIQWRHDHHTSLPLLINQSCVAIPAKPTNITLPITSFPGPIEAVIDWNKVLRLCDYYLSNAKVLIFVGFANGILIGIIKLIREEVDLDLKPKLNFLLRIAPYLCNLIAQIVSSTAYIRRENLMKMILSIQDKGFIYDSLQLGCILEKIDAENLEELLIPHAIASIGVLLSTLMLMSLSVADKARFFLSGLPVTLGFALANLAVCGDPMRLVGGLVGTGCYAIGNFIGGGVVLGGKQFGLELIALKEALNDNNTSSISLAATGIKQAWRKTSFKKLQVAFRHQFFNSITSSEISVGKYRPENEARLFNFVGKKEFQSGLLHRRKAAVLDV